jgi:alkylhydroperoxidase family enzyme
MSKVPVEVTDAIRANTEIPDEKLKQLSVFTSVMVNKRGNPSPEDVALFFKAGYTEYHILSIVLAISIKTISNYSNHLFDTELDSMMKMREKSGYKAIRKVVKFFRG